MQSKTIIISPNEENKNARGIVTLYMEDDLLKCKMRLYNAEKLDRNCKLGIYHNNEVFSANLIERADVYYSSLVGDFDLNADFYLAILNTQQNNKVLFAGGTYAGFYFNDSSVFNEMDKPPVPDTNFEKNDENLAKTGKNDAENCQNCENCKYKEFFYNTKISAQAPLNGGEQKPAPSNIINSILPQFDYIFKNYEINDELTGLIEHSKFVKMNEGEYSLGAIYENEQIKYICYAVKVAYNTPAPEELGKHYQWLPLDAADPLTDGYYLVFQDAKDLKIIEV